MDTLGGQVYGFAATIAAGLSLGLFFDLYRLWRRATRPQKVVTAISDMLFWVIATPLTYFYLLVGNWAELRFYVFLGLLLGLLLYFGAFSVVVLNLLSTLYYFVAAAIGGIIQGIWLLISVPWEGAARWHSSRRWRPGRVRIAPGTSFARVGPKWSGTRSRLWSRLSFLRK